MKLSTFTVKGEKKVKLSDFDPKYDGNIKSKHTAKRKLKKNISLMAELQDKFYAFDKYSMLIIFQAMDAAGKDSTIKHVMSGLNPQGTQVSSFKQPSAEELDHDYLWRTTKALPQRGRIGIFNRSYYEEVLVVKVHDLIKNEKLPQQLISKNIWKHRYEQIKNFEEYLFQNGTVILKFFLNVSKDEQKERFLKRLETPSKNWKFSAGDLAERQLWDEYQKCYEDAINETSTRQAPWYVIPADKKWFARLAVSEIIIHQMKRLKMEYPQLEEEQLKNLEEYKDRLNNE